MTKTRCEEKIYTYRRQKEKPKTRLVRVSDNIRVPLSGVLNFTDVVARVRLTS